MNKFYCPDCRKIFEAEGKRKEWQDPIYGKCWKNVANCSVCGRECDEHRLNISSKKNKSSSSSLGCGCSCGCSGF